MWDALVTTAAGSAATILGILVGELVGRRGQDRQWARDAQTAAYVKFLQAFAATEIELREAYTAERPNAADWESFNKSLLELSLVATPEVSTAARRITTAIGELAGLVHREPKRAQEYQRVHSEMSQGQLAFVNAARRSLGGSRDPLDWQMGGPPPWREVEQWLPEAEARNDDPQS